MYVMVASLEADETMEQVAVCFSKRVVIFSQIGLEYKDHVLTRIEANAKVCEEEINKISAEAYKIFDRINVR